MESPASARFLAAPDTSDPLLGAFPESLRRDWLSDAPLGSVLGLYTDGLVEKRGEDLSRGMARLAATLASRFGRDTDTLVDDVMRTMVSATSEDDTACLFVRFCPEL